MDSTSSPLVELKCRNCGSALNPADISPQLAAARCGHCHALFALPPALATAPITARATEARPPNFIVEQTYGGLRIVRPWRTWSAWVLLFFAVFWNGFMVVWNTIALSQGVWIMSVFGLLHTGVGLFLAYWVATRFLNRTTIEKDRGFLAVKHGPLPWPGNKKLPLDQIVQLYCKEKVSHGKNGSSTTYQLHAIMKDNKHEQLCGGIETPGHAIFLEQQIEAALGITDRAVTGDYR